MSKRSGPKAILLSVLVIMFTGAISQRGVSGKESKPNIILFYTDDQGWADTSVQMMENRQESRSLIYKTPNLRRLAREGMTFSSAYSPSPVCSPSRDSILYGKTPTRLQHSILLGKANAAPDALTIPRAIKAVDSSYVTAHFGKWACSPRTPEEAGFDISDGRTDNWHGDWRKENGLKKAVPPDDPKRIFSVTRRAKSFMEKQVAAGKPFYMRISHYAMHVHHAALEETIEKYRRAGKDDHVALYAAMAENLDTGLGLLLDTIDSLGIAARTYILFTSDNGGGFLKNGPLRGGKATLWEGGIRVPTVVRGPGIAPGSYCDVPIAGWDFLPTFRDLAGNNQSLPKEFDGGSLRSLFEKGNRGTVKRGTDPLIFHYPWFDNVPMSAIRLGDYKLVKDLNTNESRLYDVARDLGEKHDLSKSMPDMTRQLHEKLTSYLREVNAEDLEKLRTWREDTLRGWMERDRKAIEKLRQALADTRNEQIKKALQQKILAMQDRLMNYKKAMERVEHGRQATAW